ncbi:MAG: hypothetical protein HY717_15895 [Planctomycetes bacterium]|nr:hypothetical protein [Planctomycetota bacterium]
MRKSKTRSTAGPFIPSIVVFPRTDKDKNVVRAEADRLSQVEKIRAENAKQWFEELLSKSDRKLKETLELAFRCGYVNGRALERAWWLTWTPLLLKEIDWLFKKDRKNYREGLKARNEKLVARWKEISQNNDKSKKALEAQVGKEFGLKERQVRTILKGIVGNL